MRNLKDKKIRYIKKKQILLEEFTRKFIHNKVTMVTMIISKIVTTRNVSTEVTLRDVLPQARPVTKKVIPLNISSKASPWDVTRT